MRASKLVLRYQQVYGTEVPRYLPQYGGTYGMPLCYKIVIFNVANNYY